MYNNVNSLIQDYEIGVSDVYMSELVHITKLVLAALPWGIICRPSEDINCAGAGAVAREDGYRKIDATEAGRVNRHWPNVYCLRYCLSRLVLD